MQDYLEPFRLSLEKLQEVSARLRKDLVRGLGKHSHHRAAVKMLPTFVRATPDGTGEAGYLLLTYIYFISRGSNWRRHIWGHESGGEKVIKTNMMQVFSYSFHPFRWPICCFLPAESGDFLALDLGGTNFRVLHVRVVEEEQKMLKMDSQICAIPQEMMLGTGEQVTQTDQTRKH